MADECQRARLQLLVPNFCVISDDNVRLPLLNISGAALDITREPSDMFGNRHKNRQCIYFNLVAASLTIRRNGGD